MKKGMTAWKDGVIGRRLRRGRAGKLRGVAEPAGADARVRDAGKAV